MCDSWGASHRYQFAAIDQRQCGGGRPNIKSQGNEENYSGAQEIFPTRSSRAVLSL
jgi:hypothetical protein